MVARKKNSAPSTETRDEGAVVAAGAAQETTELQGNAVSENAGDSVDSASAKLNGNAVAESGVQQGPEAESFADAGPESFPAKAIIKSNCPSKLSFPGVVRGLPAYGEAEVLFTDAAHFKRFQTDEATLCRLNGWKNAVTVEWLAAEKE